MNDLSIRDDWVADALLAESGERYRQLVEVAPVAIFVHSEGRIVVANPAMVALFGAKSASQLVDRPVLDLVAPGSRELVRGRIEELYERPQAVPPAEVEYVRLDGSHFHAEVAAVSFLENGRLVAQVVAQDITARKLAERALRASEQRFRALTELSSDWYWEQDAELRFLSTAGKMSFRGGISEQDHIGKRRWELPGTEIVGQSWEDHRAVLAARASFHDLLLRRTDASGSVFYILVSGEAYYDADGGFAGYRGVAKDVTARYETEQALRDTEARLRAALDGAPAAICFYDVQERILAANSGYADLVEKSPDEIAGRPVREAIGEKAYAIAKPYIDRSLAGESTYYERRRRRADGTRRDLHIHGVPYRDESGDVIGGCALIMDVTDFKETQRRLEASEARFRALTKLSSDWYWEQDEQFRYTFFSPDIERISGISIEPNLGRTRWELPTIGVGEEEWKQHRALLDAHQPFYDFQYQRRNDRGERVWVTASGTPVFDEHGEFRGYRGIGRDITDRKRAEAALRESEERFRGLTKLSSDFYWETDAEHRFVAMVFGNTQHGSLPAEAYLGRKRWEVPYMAPGEEEWQTYREAVAARKPIRAFRLARAQSDGDLRHYEVDGDPMFDDAGVFLGYRGVGRDITDRLRAERALQHSEQRVRALLRRLTSTQEAERRRVAGDLHDLVGQNLTALGIGLTTLSAEVGKAGETQHSAAFEALARLVNDTIDAVRRTMTDLHPALLEDYGLLAALESHARQFAQRTGLAVTVQGEPMHVRPAHSVELALFRIAQEALTNAAKHARASRVRVALSLGGGFLQLAVEDDGAGFGQAPAPRPEARTGWGLPLMRERAAEAGGTLHIVFPGKGTRVVAKIPHVDPHRPG